MKLSQRLWHWNSAALAQEPDRMARIPWRSTTEAARLAESLEARIDIAVAMLDKVKARLLTNRPAYLDRSGYVWCRYCDCEVTSRGTPSRYEAEHKKDCLLVEFGCDIDPTTFTKAVYVPQVDHNGDAITPLDKALFAHYAHTVDDKRDEAEFRDDLMHAADDVLEDDDYIGMDGAHPFTEESNQI